MPITDILEKNCRLYGDDVALVEINPEMPETKRTTWKEFDLIEPSRAAYYQVLCLKSRCLRTES